MLDFTSAAYLGLRHRADWLPAWPAISEAQPAALHEAPVLARVGRDVARLQGEEDGVAGSSTLVLAMDALGPALHGLWRVLVDAGCYPLLLWAAAQRGPRAPVRVEHHRPSALARALQGIAPGIRPILVVDGFCVGCGRSAPLGAYAQLLARRGGRLLVDDTQALGVLGPGGGGTPAQGAPADTVLRLASLAKAFNAPLAVLSGSRRDIAAFRRSSASRMYCSPPSMPTALAAARALALNAGVGGRLRALLRARILAFRRACAAMTVPLGPGLFPVQTVFGPHEDAPALVAALAALGIRVFASRGFHDGERPRLRLIVTASHRPAELRQAAALLSIVLGRRNTTRREDAHGWTV
ncbi:MAG: hypothetical protein NVSMB18_06430 [Acetobacteraceae bacterium]